MIKKKIQIILSIGIVGLSLSACGKQMPYAEDETKTMQSMEITEEKESESAEDTAAGTETDVVMDAVAESESELIMETNEETESLAEEEVIGIGNSLDAKGKELLSLMQDTSGYTIEFYAYDDLDFDGENELVGVYPEDMVYHTWYCSSDGTVCKEVKKCNGAYDYCRLELLDLGKEIHIAVNCVNMVGTGKQFDILALHEGNIESLVSDHYGYVKMDEEGNILLDIEAYDARYDASLETYLGHTWKDTYLYYVDGVYKEYGAVQIDKDTFLKYENAIEVLDTIRTKKQSESNDEIEFFYLVRENGIVHVQCALTKEDGSIQFFYYTLKDDNNRLVGDLEYYDDGQMLTSFSTLEVTYPEE